MASQDFKDYVNGLTAITSLGSSDVIVTRDSESAEARKLSGANFLAQIQALIDAATAAPPALTLHTLTDQDYSSSAWTKLAWADLDVSSNDGFGSFAVSFDTYTIPETGLYLFQGHMTLGGSFTTFNYMKLVVNGSEFYLAQHFTGNDGFTFTHRCAANDIVSVQFITDGSNLKILEKTLNIFKLAR